MTTMPGTNRPKILFDSDGIIALVKPFDPSHNRIEKIFDDLVSRDCLFFIGSTTLAETLTTLQRKYGDKKLTEYVYEQLVVGKTEIVQVGAVLFSDAYSFYQSSKSKKNTIFDAINIAIVKSLDLDAIFSFDEWYTKNKVKLAEKFLMTSS